MTAAAQYTKQQQRAIAARGMSVALDAGAGCGKTFVLTERFLSHLAPSDNAFKLGELVAITFTDAAAREMRTRVRQKCLDRLEEAPDEQAGYWLRLLRSLDAARVSTIHAFCSNLVRAQALELGLDPNFHVLDQPAADVMMSEATDDWLRVALDRRNEDVMTLAADFDMRGLKSRLASFREIAGSGVLDEWASKPAGETVAAWRDFFDNDFQPAQQARLAETPEVGLIRSLIPESTGSTETRAKLAELDALLQALQDQRTGEEDLGRIRQLAMVRGVCGKKDDWPSPEVKKWYADACATLRKQLDKRVAWEEGERTFAAADLGQRLARAAESVATAYQASKAAASALDFHDLLTLTRRMLTQPEFASVRRQISRSIKLLLVDEFQDTDQVQVDIVKGLVGDSLTDGGLFFVGDFKQSIYRFRGAEPQVFLDLQDETPEEGRLPLSKNFRSQPAVLEFVNALFAPLFGAGYLALDAARPQVAPKPAVQFLWTHPPDDGNVAQARQAEAQRIAQHVQQLLADPTERVAEQVDSQWTARRVKAGDIAILFRALSDVQYYEEALRDAKIEHHLIGGHAFYSQQEVFDLLNLLRSVVSRCDEVSLAGVLRSPFFSLEDETLLWLNRAGGSLNAGLLRKNPLKEIDAKQQQRVDHAREVLHELRSMRGAANTAQVIQTALARTGYDATLLSEFLGERKLANLEKIIEQARAADANRPGDLDAFVRQLSEFIARQPKEALAATAGAEEGKVQLMTVHHSKGLEFPVVIVADLARPVKPSPVQAAFHPKLGPLVKPNSDQTVGTIALDLHRMVQTQHEREESLRMFYVACTRAADTLVLSSAVKDVDKPEGEWLKALAGQFHLQTGVCKRTPDDQPLADVVPQPPEAKEQQQEQKRRPDVPKLLDEAASKKHPSEIPSTAEPIDLDPRDLRRFSVSRLSGKLHYRAERRGRDTANASDEPIDPLGFGTLVHAVMERMDFAVPNNIAEWCKALSPLHLRRNWEAAAAESEELVTRFLASDRCGQLAASPQVEREIEFLMPWPLDGHGDPDALLQGYIDCLYADPQGGWRLLDYKTNRVEPEQASKAAETYRLQMSVYALAVERSLGVAPASLDVHFLRPGVEASFAWDNNARTAAVKAIDQAITRVREEAVQHD